MSSSTIFKRGDVIYYDETDYGKFWVGLITRGGEHKPHQWDVEVRWFQPDKLTFMGAAPLPARGVITLIGNIDNGWVEWDV